MKGEVESIQDPSWWNQDGVMSVMDHVGEKLGRNTGVKALFGGAVKKPLMTKVSTRHLNEIVRERNQYSRDALEAWQDFINLKGRMDTELSKVTKRNNFLVEELETWKQQFLKFQAFAEQLTKETSELKVKMEGHKRENRRLTALIDQQKDDAARLTLRLSGTEKQRDDALEALVLQQEIAEELERERKRNQKELGAIQHANSALTRQRDEAQRIVVHLRSLIDGQTHHMEHILRTLGNSTELSDFIEQGYDEIPEEPAESGRRTPDARSLKRFSRSLSRLRLTASSRASSIDDDVTPEMEHHLLNMDKQQRRLSQLSMSDVADRYLRDKTDAIATIIRNISEQCAAAVEGLHLARNAEDENPARKQERLVNNLATSSDDGRDSSAREEGSEMGEESGFLSPDNHGSSIPPTPDLVHNRSSTSMSMISSSTIPERSSVQYVPGDIPTKIVEDDDESAHETETLDGNADTANVSKQPSQDLMRPSTARIVS
jgi:hypothetical protein